MSNSSYLRLCNFVDYCKVQNVHMMTAHTYISYGKENANRKGVLKTIGNFTIFSLYVDTFAPIYLLMNLVVLSYFGFRLHTGILHPHGHTLT